MPKLLLINKENIVVPAIISVLLFLGRKITGLDWLYFLNLLSVAWVLAATSARLLKNFTPKITVNNRTTDLLAIVIILIYGIVFSALSVARQDAYSTSMYDLGNMDQAIWNSTQGNFLEVTSIGAQCLNVTRAINHLEWIYEFFALLYRVIPDIRILLVMQTLFVCAGLAGLYLIARTTIKSPELHIISLCIAALYPSLQLGNLFDFHGDVLAFPFLVWMIYFYEIPKKRMISALFMLCALSCKEYVALVLAFYGILLIVKDKDWRWGSVVICISTGYFIAAIYWIMPLFNHGNSSEIISTIYTIKKGSGLYGLLNAILLKPEHYSPVIFSQHSFESLFYLFFPVFFLLWKSPAFLIPVIPILTKDLLAGIDIGTHRIALTLPFLFVSYLYTMKKMEMEKVMKCNVNNMFNFNILLVVSASVIAAAAYGPSPLGHRFYRELEKYVKDTTDIARDSVITNIPENSVVSVSGLLAPHCTHRRFCYQFPRPFDTLCTGASHVDVIVLDTNDKESHMKNHSGFKNETLPWIISMGYTQIMERRGIYLFQWSDSIIGKNNRVLYGISVKK